MSARNATTGPGLPPLSRPTTPVLATPVFTSRPRLREVLGDERGRARFLLAQFRDVRGYRAARRSACFRSRPRAAGFPAPGQEQAIAPALAAAWTPPEGRTAVKNGDAVTWAFSGAGMEMMRGCPPSTGISRTNLNLTHMVPIFGAFRKVLSVLVADRLQAGPKRHSIESETIGRGAPRRKATCKQDCHSLRPMTAPGPFASVECCSYHVGFAPDSGVSLRCSERSKRAIRRHRVDYSITSLVRPSVSGECRGLSPSLSRGLKPTRTCWTLDGQVGGFRAFDILAT